ncbi:MAG: glycosyltransferase family 9 protein [Capsulimonadales bacterium]|nr:glycosyltransferase family 9 protein [Capsulimonadales bacterium]
MASLMFPEFVAPEDPINLPVRRCSTSAERASRRILIQRNGAHGDILMATPVLTALRDAWPDAHITWIVERKEAVSINAHPLVDRLLLWDSAYWKRMIRRVQLVPWVLRCMTMRRQLVARNFDIFISYQPEEWQLLARGCGAATRIGVFDTYREFYGATETSGNARYYTRAFVHAEHPPHRTDQYLLPLGTLGIAEPEDRSLSIGYTGADAERAEGFLTRAGLTPGNFVTVAPLTTWPSRCWPADRFRRLIEVLDQDGFPVVLVGSQKERPEIEAIAEQLRRRPPVLAGELTFREFAAFVDRAALVVSGDTGPMHLAAAVKTPYLALFGPTAPGRFAPRGCGIALSKPVPCGPCYQKTCRNTGDDLLQCLRLISVTEAVEAARKLLNESPV